MTYDFYCPKCSKVYEKKLSMKEHDEVKNKLICSDLCDTLLVQKVAPLRFKLQGYGWCNSELTQGIDPWGISDTEIRNNLDEEKRKEEWCNEEQERDKKEGF